MECPYCHAQIDAGSKFCTECGANLAGAQTGSDQSRRQAALASNSGLLLGAAARQARLEAAFDPNQLISTRAYNLIIVAVLLWGLLINVLLCAFAADFAANMNPIVFLILYFVCAFVGIRMAAKSTKPAVSFLGYNLVVVPFGLMISVMVSAYGGLDSYVVRDAFVYTLLMTLGMMAMVMIAPDFFSKLGGALLGCLVGLVLCELVLLLLGARQELIDWLAAGLFSLYIGYDIYRSQQFPKTVDNAIDSALDIYLDIANLFIRLLEIIGRRKD